MLQLQLAVSSLPAQEQSRVTRSALCACLRECIPDRLDAAIRDILCGSTSIPIFANLLCLPPGPELKHFGTRSCYPRPRIVDRQLSDRTSTVCLPAPNLSISTPANAARSISEGASSRVRDTVFESSMYMSVYGI